MPSKNGQSPLTELRTVGNGVMDFDSDLRVIHPDNYRKLFCGSNSVVTNKGTVVNVPANVHIAFRLYNGINKVIGAFEDLKGSSIVFCVYNSLGYHTILRWFRNKQGYINGVIEKIIDVKDPLAYDPYNPNPLNFQILSEFNITGGFIVDNYFYFTDNFNRLKFIDLERANENGKRRKFNIYFNRASFTTPTTYTLTLWQGGNAVPLNSWSYTATLAGTYQLQVTAFLDFYKSMVGNNAMSAYFNADSCNDTSVKITMNSEGEYYIELTSTNVNQPSVVPDNFYPDHNGAVSGSYDPFSLDLIDRLCYTPVCNPTAAYLTDVSRETNFVRNKAYQFRARYQYFDNSYSVYSAISTIPIASHECDPNNYGNQDNYIILDFTDERLENPATASIIKRVELAMLEPVLGSEWVTIKRLEPFEVVGVGMQNYRFYNDQTTEPIDPTLTVKPFESLPLKCKADELADDRSFTGGLVEGYDRPCIDAVAEVIYHEAQTFSNRYDINGKYYLRNIHFGGTTGTGQPFSVQVVWQTSASNTAQQIWGGMYRGLFTLGVPRVDTAGDPATNFFQTCESGGFVPYLAGTNYFAITKQVWDTAPLNIISNLGLSINPITGALILTTIQNYIDAYALMNFLCQTGNENKVWQEFSIKQVPDNNVYVLRTASHLTTPAELGGVDIAYQQSSTNAFVYNTLDQHEQIVTISGGNVTVGGWWIYDLASCGASTPSGSQTTALMGYIVAPEDASEPFSGTDVEQFKADTRVELALASNALTYTDHNGYFYAGFGTGSIDINDFFSGVLNPNITEKINHDGSVWIAVPLGFGAIGYFRSTDATLLDDGRTIITGQVLINGTAIAQGGVSVINSQGSVDITDSINGFFRIITYPNTNPTPNDVRAGTLYYVSSESLCIFNFTFNFYTYPAMAINSANYNFSNVFNVIPINYVTIVSYNQSISGWARGSDRYLGLVYGDEGDRKTAVAPLNAQTHITWYTETDPVTGIINLLGRASIRVTIHNRPPEWATKYWIVASENQQNSSSLMWVVNDVATVDGASPPVPATGATAVMTRIGIQNIGYYTQQHPNSTINYTFIKGDRIRFYSDDASGNALTTYQDYEILSTDGVYIFIPLDNSFNFAPGAIFQFYTPRGKDQTKIFYEIGFCGHIESAVINGELQKYHVGTAQDQTYGVYPQAVNIPAIVDLEWGDVYYRQRTVPYNYDPSQPTVVPINELINIQDDSISDFFDSNTKGWGRPNTDAIEQGQVVRGSTERFSNIYRSGTLINGLRNFEPLNEKQFSTTYGLINKNILVDNTTMVVLFSNSFCISIYIGQDIIRSVNGNPNLISISDEVIPRANKMQRQFGTVNPESVALNDQGDLFWWDEIQGTAVRRNVNGLHAISDELMNSYFTRVGQLRNDLGRNNSNTPAIYDKSNDLYILSFSPMSPKAEVKSCAIINALDIDPAIGTSVLSLWIRPLNINLLNIDITSDPRFPDISAMIIYWVNHGSSGYTASLDEYGAVKLCSPDGTSIYYNQSAVLDFLTGSGTTSFTYTFVNGQPAGTGIDFEGETVAFCKSKTGVAHPNGGWTEFYPFVPEFFGLLRTEYVSFVDGNLWLHGDIGNYNNFYGVDYERKLTVPFNANWQKIKTFISLEVNVNQKPFCPNITVPPTEQAPFGMNTELTKAHFKVVFGKYWAAMTKDKLTPDELMQIPPTPDNKWTNGRELRGQVALVEICDDSNTLAPIIETQMSYILSEKS